MSEILIINNDNVIIGNDDGTTTQVKKDNLNYQNAKVGDTVRVFKTEDQTIISKISNPTDSQVVITNMNNVDNVANTNLSAKITTINKHVFVWVGTFLFGGLGVDRFMRGQVGLGLLKLFFGWVTLGIWALIDWIIGLVKAYSTFSDTEKITFVNGKYSK